MSERDGFGPGVPCWVDTWQPDPAAAASFYAALFGWEPVKLDLPEAPGEIFICRLRDRAAAAISWQPPDSPAPPTWNTHIWVDSADETAARATEAGGSVLVEPFDNFETGRMAVLADPSGAVFCLLQPNEHRGAEVVNEPGAWAMSALNARDPEGAKTFYGSVFGWEPDSFELGGMEVTLFRLPGFVGGEPQQPVPRDVIATMIPIGDQVPAEVPPHWSVDFWVADVDATAERVAELGGQVIAPPTDIPGAGFRQGVVADPEGATFSVTRVPGGA